MSERNEKEAGKLILNNFQMFNEAVLLFEREIQPAVLKAFDQAFEHACKEAGWYCVADFAENENAWFCLDDWILPNEEDSAIANFYADYAAHSTDDYYVLDDFCALNGGVGFTFCVNHEEFGGKSAWNKFYRAQGADITQALIAKGFIDDRNGVFFLPFKLDISLLANAWENDDYANLMQPVVDAMRVIAEALPVFEDLISLAKKEFHS